MIKIIRLGRSCFYQRWMCTSSRRILSPIVSPGKVSPERFVPDHIEKPFYFHRPSQPENTVGEIEIKTKEQIERMRESCKLAANVLESCRSLVKIGVTTDDIDKFVHEKIISANAYPSPLRYAGFPKSVCTSVNNIACHGIPDDRPLEDGDIINIDISVYLKGYHGDCSRTFIVGNTDEDSAYLIQCTEECVHNAINLCKPKVPFNIIGNYISWFCSHRGLNVIPAFVGHGIGTYFHGPPEIIHYENKLPGCMQEGMVFTIEPILTAGHYEVEIQEDGWTASTVDGLRTAQHEHTILITSKGSQILTIPD